MGLFDKKFKPTLPVITVEFFKATGAEEIESNILQGANNNLFNKIICKRLLDNYGIDITN